MGSSRLLARILTVSGLLAGLAVSLAGCVVLNGLGVVAVVVAAVLVWVTAYAAVEDSPPAVRRAVAWKAAGAAAGLILLVAGIGVLGGAGEALLAGGLAAAVGTVVSLLRVRARRGSPDAKPADDEPAAELPPLAHLGQPGAPVALLSTCALTREWADTTAGLRSQQDPAARCALVRRRQEVLDELERRDPAGFARWLADGAVEHADPSSYLRKGRATDSDAA